MLWASQLYSWIMYNIIYIDMECMYCVNEIKNIMDIQLRYSFVVMEVMSRKMPNLVWQGSGHRVTVATLFVFAFHEKGQQFAFPFDIDGSSSNKAKAILLQDVIAILHHLMAVHITIFRWKIESSV